MKKIDVVGVGIGPFNLSLAALINDTELSSVFFDQKPAFDWHQGLMFDSATLQVPFMADLVTMVDPMHPMTFLNYLKEKKRLYPFFFKKNFFILRKEYNDYCQWVAQQLPHCHFGNQVTKINVVHHQGEDFWVVHSQKNHEKQRVITKNIVLGVGSSPKYPDCLDDSFIQQETVLHSSEYLFKAEKIHSNERITLVGSGQSAGEIMLDLLNKGIKNIHWITKNSGFFPMESTPLAEEHFTPKYIDYFYPLDESTKARRIRQQSFLYKGISTETLTEIYDVLYANAVDGKPMPSIIPGAELMQGNIRGDGQQLHLEFNVIETSKSLSVDTDWLILATGYEARKTNALVDLSEYFTCDDQGQLKISREYSLIPRSASTTRKVFVQNAEMHSHGVGAPDLTLGAYRSAVIANQLMETPLYQIENNRAFTHFGGRKEGSLKDAQHSIAQACMPLEPFHG
ncbi:MAG: SidA/IucD/PvdA family monooxygenase [Cellvibrionales bacterium]|nr:SidA/IucD/PvdA family monooxygenase [Cellvibrionales bacterium]